MCVHKLQHYSRSSASVPTKLKTLVCSALKEKAETEPGVRSSCPVPDAIGHFTFTAQ